MIAHKTISFRCIFCVVMIFACFLQNNAFARTPLDSFELLSVASNDNDIQKTKCCNKKRVFLYPRVMDSCFQRFSAKVNDGFVVYQDDIVFGPQEEVREITDNLDKNYGENQIKVAGSALKLLSRSAYAWPKGLIPYTIDSDLEWQRPLIEGAMVEWSEKTNIEFVDYNLNRERIKDTFGTDVVWRIHIIRDNSGGSASYVGLRKYSIEGLENAQPLWLSEKARHETVLHELGHVIGLWHEHNRPDRDQYVKIFKQHVKEERLDNFHIGNGQMVGDYDHQSIMHYSSSIFSNNGHPTFQALDTIHISQRAYVGRSKHISQGDIEAVNAIYPQ